MFVAAARVGDPTAQPVRIQVGATTNAKQLES
jgi:hypothetical protein